MTDDEFRKFATKIGQARNANRGEEDRLRSAGNSEGANKIYLANKATVEKILKNADVHPKDFDDHMQQFSKSSGQRVNVKMTNMFPDWGKGKTEASSVHVSPKDQEPTPKEGYVDPRYADLKKQESKRAKESANFDDDAPRPIDLKTLYQKPEYKPGWHNGVYSPPILKQQKNENVVVKEF